MLGVLLGPFLGPLLGTLLGPMLGTFLGAFLGTIFGLHLGPRAGSESGLRYLFMPGPAFGHCFEKSRHPLVQCVTSRSDRDRNVIPHIRPAHARHPRPLTPRIPPDITRYNMMHGTT